jgi:hypothetical protein
MPADRRIALPLLAALALAALVGALSACGYTSDSTDVVEGEPLTLGDLKYNVTFSRYLNPKDNEDSAYLVGQPPPPEGSTYFGVFLEVQNESDQAQPLPATTFPIKDANGDIYEVVPSESLYAFPFLGRVEPHEQVPTLDSTAQQGPIEGSLVLYLLPAEASDNRPLTLEMEGTQGEKGEVTLDL